MKRVLKILYSLMMCLKNYIIWMQQAKQCSISLDGRIDIKDEIELEENEKIIVVVPHPDDELIACHSIIQKYKKNTVVFYSGMLGNDYSEKNREIRTNEFIKYCETIGVQYIVNSNDLYKQFSRILNSYNFKYIFAPSVVDWHEEHRNLFLLVTDVLKNINLGAEVFCYKVTVPIPEKFITHYSDMTLNEQRYKWQLFKKIYISQKNMPTQRFKISEKAYRKNGKKAICESFVKVSDRLLNETFVCKVEQKQINNLTMIMETSEKEYERVFVI